VQRLHLGSFQRRTIRPEPPEGEKYRFNWNSPILISPHDPRTIYYGGHRLFGSKDRGETWTLVTPDLTANAERDKLPIFGKTAKDFFSRKTASSISGRSRRSPSSAEAGVLWVGTDGPAVSKDAARPGPRRWKPPDVPKGTTSRSRRVTGEGAAYVARRPPRQRLWRYLFHRGLRADLKPISKYPRGGVSVIREHRGIRTVARGAWRQGELERRRELGAVMSALPTVPSRATLVLATHGRGSIRRQRPPPK
jgi:hypothetical protein